MSGLERDSRWIARTGAMVLILNLAVAAVNTLWLWKFQSTSLAITEQQSLIDTKLKQIDLAVQETKNSIALQSSRLGLTENTLRMIEQLIPKPSISQKPTVSITGKNNLVMTWEVANLGDLSFTGESPEIYLTQFPILDRSDLDKAKPIKIKVTHIDRVGMVVPKDKRLMSLQATLLEKPTVFYWLVTLTVDTNEVLAELVRQSLDSRIGDSISNEATISLNGNAVVNWH